MPKVRSIRAHEIVPSAGPPFSAGTRQRQVLDMKRAQILFEFFRRGCASELFSDTSFEGAVEGLAGQIPGGRSGFGKQTVDQGTMSRQERRGRRTGRATRLGILSIFRVLLHTYAHESGCALLSPRHPISELWHPKDTPDGGVSKSKDTGRYRSRGR